LHYILKAPANILLKLLKFYFIVYIYKLKNKFPSLPRRELIY